MSSTLPFFSPKNSAASSLEDPLVQQDLASMARELAGIFTTQTSITGESRGVSPRDRGLALLLALALLQRHVPKAFGISYDELKHAAHAAISDTSAFNRAAVDSRTKSIHSKLRGIHGNE